MDDADEAGLDLAEEAELMQQRERLMHAEGLAAAASGAAEALSPSDDEGGAVVALGMAVAALAPMVPVNPALAGPHAELVSAQAALQEAGLTLRAYLEDLDAEPGRLAEVEERLEVYSRMGRRYGPGTEAVLRRAAEAREALQSLDEGAGDVLALAQERERLLDEALEVALALREARAEAAPRMAEAVREQLADLAMPRAELRVEIVEDHSDPPADSCVIWLRANPGLPEAPLAATASGGELSRVLLALHGLAAAADDATWVLDEVDAGIGGVTATAVGARLRDFARGRQVVVITHLPQVAAMADAHYRLVKGLDEDGRATTRIEPVEGDELVGGALPHARGERRGRGRPPPRRGTAGPPPRLRGDPGLGESPPGAAIAAGRTIRHGSEGAGRGRWPARGAPTSVTCRLALRASVDRRAAHRRASMASMPGGSPPAAGLGLR